MQHRKREANSFRENIQEAVSSLERDVHPLKTSINMFFHQIGYCEDLMRNKFGNINISEILKATAAN